MGERLAWVQAYRPRSKGGPRPDQQKVGQDMFTKNGWHQKWPLHWEAMRGNVQAIYTLCDWNSWAMDPNQPMLDYSYAEPIQIAALFGQLEAMKALIILGANAFGPPNTQGNTAESGAVMERHHHVTLFLVDFALREMQKTAVQKVLLDSTQQLGCVLEPHPKKVGARIKEIDPYGQAAFKYPWLQPGFVVLFMNSTPISDMKMNTIMGGIAMLPQCELMVVSRRFNLSGFNTFYKSLGYK